MPRRKKSSVPRETSPEETMLQALDSAPSTVERFEAVSAYFAEQGASLAKMVDVVKGMLEATEERYSQSAKKIQPRPDWKTRDRGLYWLHKIHLEWIETKQDDQQVPTQFVQIYNDFRQQAQNQNPAELDEKYGVVTDKDGRIVRNNSN